MEEHRLQEWAQLRSQIASLNYSAISSDSRAVLAGLHQNDRLLYFARRGSSRDGHDFLKDLSGRTEIVGFVVEEMPEGFSAEAPVFTVRDSSFAMAMVAKELYRDPTASALTVAVTGTNGKTTSTFLLQYLLERLGKRTALSGTVHIQFGDFRLASPLTTPDFSVMQKNFSDLRGRGAEAFVFEASSHALDQRRLLGIELDGALFTNLTQEHLDYHQNMENYYLAKRRLFTEVLRSSRKRHKWAIVHDDGAYGSRLIEELRGNQDFELWTWGQRPLKNARHLQIVEWKSSLVGSDFLVRLQNTDSPKDLRIKTPLIGRHNVENLMGVLTAGLAMGHGVQEIHRALQGAVSVPGRLERVNEVSPLNVFVDYAHTPDALENVLGTLRNLCSGRLILVFGCGGDRDKGKRPKMGQVAELYADSIFVTSDNPRSEDPQSILDAILAGMQRLKKTVSEVDRAKAIELALQELQPEDVLLIAGKGHETYQIIGNQRFDFDDREVTRRLYRAKVS